MYLKEEDILKEVNRVFAKYGAKVAKIKVYQVETFNGKRPKIFVQTLNPDGIKRKLESLGLTVEEKETRKQNTLRYSAKDGHVESVIPRNLHTINWIIKKS